MSDSNGAGQEPDWAAETVGRLEELIDKVRTQTTDRVVMVARAVVYGLLVAVLGLMAGILLLIASVRALDALIPQEVWLTYLIVGAIFTAAGLFVWSKRQPRTEGA
ncbi:MAG: hypothetical protein AB1673_06340 [Actinomycetota bacterium]